MYLKLWWAFHFMSLHLAIYPWGFPYSAISYQVIPTTYNACWAYTFHVNTHAHKLTHTSVGLCSSIRCTILAFYRHVEIAEIAWEIDMKPTKHSHTDSDTHTLSKLQSDTIMHSLTSAPSNTHTTVETHSHSYSAVDTFAAKTLVPTHQTTGEVKTRATGTAALWEGGVG